MAKGKGDPPVEWTVTLEQLNRYLSSLRPWSGQEELKLEFDEMPVQEIREICLENITDIGWLTARVKAYIGINDYPTVFMLLRTLGRLPTSSDDSQKNFLELMVEVARVCLESFKHRFYLKDALVILCGKLYYNPELYNERVRKLFEDILKKYDGNGRYGMHEEESRILIRIFLVLSKLGDKSFLPQLREYLPSVKYLAHLMAYSNTCKDEVLAEGLRLLLIRHLENLPDNTNDS